MAKAGNMLLVGHLWLCSLLRYKKLKREDYRSLYHHSFSWHLLRRSCNLLRWLGVSLVASLRTAPDIQTTGSGCCPEEWQRRISNLLTGCDGARVSEWLIQTSTVKDSPGNLFDPAFCHVSKSKVICLSEWSRRGVKTYVTHCLGWILYQAVD